MSSAVQLYEPALAIYEVADFLADPVTAAQFPKHRIRWRNDRAAACVGLNTLSDAQWIDHFGKFQPLSGSLDEPLALRYHGHQFRVYNPDIGDGRGFLFAQLRDGDRRLLDLGTKGSGTTPYSRFGDGRLTLKGGVREVLATEMLTAFGVETSQTFSLIETGEQLHRGDEPSPTRSAVLVRLSHGHIRVGSFQRLAALGLTDELEQLVSYCLRHYYSASRGETTAAGLLCHVVQRTARLAASYMAAGFVHGVLNSDNVNITGESFDYGPWRFAPTFDAGFTAAYFDSAGLYAFGRQAEAIQWDLAQLAGSLLPIADRRGLQEALDSFGPAYRAHLIDRFLWRLGVVSQGEEANTEIVRLVEAALTESQVSIDRFFFDWAGGRPGTGYEDGLFRSLDKALAAHSSRIDRNDAYWQGGQPCSMLIEEVEAIWAPIVSHDDWTLFHEKIAKIRAMGAALANRDGPH